MRARQQVNLRVPRSVVVRAARGRPLVTAISRPFWHRSGTPPLVSCRRSRYSPPVGALRSGNSPPRSRDSPWGDVRVAACRRGSGPRGAHLCELIGERAGRLLILTSARSPAGWYRLFPSLVVAESLLGKLINTSRQVLMTGPGYRPRKRPGRSPGHEERQRKSGSAAGSAGSARRRAAGPGLLRIRASPAAALPPATSGRSMR
jgi:hypothetical protein